MDSEDVDRMISCGSRVDDISDMIKKNFFFFVSAKKEIDTDFVHVVFSPRPQMKFDDHFEFLSCLKKKKKKNPVCFV